MQDLEDARPSAFPIGGRSDWTNSRSCSMLKSKPQDLRLGAEADHASLLGLAYFQNGVCTMISRASVRQEASRSEGDSEIGGQGWEPYSNHCSHLQLRARKAFALIDLLALFRVDMAVCYADTQAQSECVKSQVHVPCVSCSVQTACTEVKSCAYVEFFE